MQKTTQHCRKKLRKTQINESICHGLEELTSLKCPYYPKHSIDQHNSIKIPTAYYRDLEQIFQKFMWNQKRP